MQQFEEVVDRCQRGLYTYAVYFLGRNGEAEEVAQEAFLRLWNHRETIDIERVDAWLHRVTRNLCFDRLRRRRVANAVVQQGLETEQFADGSPDPEETSRATDFRKRLESALSELKDPMKSVLILREVQGFKYQEISERLDLPLNSVRVYVHRGRKRLRNLLSEGVAFENQL